MIIADYLSLNDLYRSLVLGEPHPSGSICCDPAQILLDSEHTHTAIITHLATNVALPISSDQTIFTYSHL